MIKKIISYCILFLIFAGILMTQMYIIDSRNLFGIKPNIILISVIVVSLWYGLHVGSIYGLIVGIITDILFGNTFGIFTISYVLVGVIVGYLNYNYRKESKGSLCYLTIFGTCIFEFIQFIIYNFLSSSGFSLIYLIIQMLISSILNVAIAFILYGLFIKISNYAENNILDLG